MRKFGLILFITLVLALSGCAQQPAADTAASTDAPSFSTESTAEAGGRL